MQELFRKIKWKHMGFVIGIILLLSGWLIRLVVAFILGDLLTITILRTLDKVGTAISGTRKRGMIRGGGR